MELFGVSRAPSRRKPPNKPGLPAFTVVPGRIRARPFFPMDPRSIPGPSDTTVRHLERMSAAGRIADETKNMMRSAVHETESNRLSSTANSQRWVRGGVIPVASRGKTAPLTSTRQRKLRGSRTTRTARSTSRPPKHKSVSQKTRRWSTSERSVDKARGTMLTIRQVMYSDRKRKNERNEEEDVVNEEKSDGICIDSLPDEYTLGITELPPVSLWRQKPIVVPHLTLDRVPKDEEEEEDDDDDDDTHIFRPFSGASISRTSRYMEGEKRKHRKMLGWSTVRYSNPGSLMFEMETERGILEGRNKQQPGRMSSFYEGIPLRRVKK